jgi:hypothetical protein
LLVSTEVAPLELWLLLEFSSLLELLVLEEGVLVSLLLLVDAGAAAPAVSFYSYVY